MKGCSYKSAKPLSALTKRLTRSKAAISECHFSQELLDQVRALPHWVLGTKCNWDSFLFLYSSAQFLPTNQVHLNMLKCH